MGRIALVGQSDVETDSKEVTIPGFVMHGNVDPVARLEIARLDGR